MLLTITRHGETELNKELKLQGSIQGKLNETGLMQAEKVAKRLADVHFDIIYSSDLRRAAHTSEIIHKYHPDTELVMTKELRERSFGEIQGENMVELGLLRDGVRYHYKMDLYLNPPGGESLREMFDRAVAYVVTLKQQHSGDHVLLVAHAGIDCAWLPSKVKGWAIWKNLIFSGTLVFRNIQLLWKQHVPFSLMTPHI